MTTECEICLCESDTLQGSHMSKDDCISSLKLKVSELRQKYEMVSASTMPAVQDAVRMSFALGNIARMATQLRENESLIEAQKQLDTIIRVAEQAAHPLRTVT